MNIKNHRLIIFSGPSCVGKSPLAKALARLYPDLYQTMKPLVLYNSRSPRPGEINGTDYHFRSMEEIEKRRKDDHFVVMDVRGDLQAIDLQEVSSSLAQYDLFFEGNPFIGRVLQTHPALSDLNRLSIFMSPLSRNEIQFLKSVADPGSLSELVTDVMRRKLLRRTRKQKGELSLKDLENIEKRASSAFRELQDAHFFQYVIPNHDGEDSENWDAFYYPLGDAREALLTFVALLEGGKPEKAEKWPENLIPG